MFLTTACITYSHSSVTFAQLLQSDPSIAKDFQEVMCAEEMAVQLRTLELIPEELKRDILNSRNEKDANSYLLTYLRKKADEKTVREILEHASTMEGYGKMNAFAAGVLRKLR